MSPSPHTVILASAGTGKTFQLSNRFLNLLFDGVAPERILATTFTRKAAGEILDRVLERLVEGSETAKGCEQLGQDLGRPQLGQQQCLELLANTTRRLNTFQIRTIDSFFMHLAKLFALDLELPPGWTICDERVDDAMRSDALQDLLAEESLEGISTLIRELLKGKAQRGVQRALLDKIKELRNVHLETRPGAWASLTPGTCLDEKSLGQASAAFEQVELPQTKQGKPNNNWQKARVKLLRRVALGDWEAILEDGLGEKYLKGEHVYYKLPMSEEFLAALKPIVEQACYEVVSLLAGRNRAASELLDSFEAAYQARKRSLGFYGFTDLPHALAPNTAKALPLDERELDLWFRLDGRIDHLLLDEFQDTAPVQWRILAPIAEEITAEGDGSRSFFCVGDAKQSIYSFRQAEPRLLTNLCSLLPALGAAETMVKSYRSSKVVLETVNHVFTDLAASSIFASDEYAPQRQGAVDFSQSFDAHEAARKLPGAAFLIEAREPEDASKYNKPERDTLVQERLLERVQLVLNEGPGASVGILTRTRKPIPAIIHALREAGIDASGEGGNVLTDARSVVVFLSLLHLADFPDDSAAAFHVSHSAFADFVGLDPRADGQARRAKSQELRLALATLGLANFVSRYHEQVVQGDSWSAWDRARFGQLHDLAFSFEASGENRPSAFIDHVRICRVEAPGGAAVRVMTIHASKGLEFDAVLLPEIGAAFAANPSKVLVDRPLPQELIQRAVMAPKKDLTLASPELQELYNNDKARAVCDDLCVLYVAMTRAAHRIELILPWPKPSNTRPGSDQPTVAKLLRERLCSGEEEVGDDGVLWSHGENSEDWCPQGQVEPPRATPTGEQQPIRFAPITAPRSLPRRRPSSEEGGGKRSIADAIGSSRGADIGTLTHAIFEGLEWSEDFELESAMDHASLRCASQANRDQAREIAGRALESKAIVTALSRAACSASGAELEVLREGKFSLLLDGVLWNCVIDRLVIAREGGRVVSAEITDYKTDHVPASGSADLVQHYRPQLERYAQLIGEIHQLDRQAIHCRLIFLGAGEVCEVS